jgi:nitrous oxide reductase
MCPAGSPHATWANFTADTSSWRALFSKTHAKALPFLLIKKENAQLISGKPDENHITKQTPHGAAPTHDTLENNRAQTRKHHSNKTRRLGEHYGEEETGVLESHTGQEHCLSKLAYSRAFTNLARYSGDEKMQRFRA